MSPPSYEQIRQFRKGIKPRCVSQKIFRLDRGESNKKKQEDVYGKFESIVLGITFVQSQSSRFCGSWLRCAFPPLSLLLLLLSCSTSCSFSSYLALFLLYDES